MKNDYSNQLIFGKQGLERIVSVETKDDKLIVFQQVNHQVIRHDLDNFFWLITHKKLSSKQQQLKGEQHFQWVALFDNFEEKEVAKKKVQHTGHDVYSIYDHKESSLVFQGLTYFKNLQPKQIATLSFDLETDGLVQHSQSKIFIIANTFRDSFGNVEQKNFSLDHYAHNGDMILDWCEWVRQKDPSFIVGHNIFSFDLPYLNHVAQLWNIHLNLGRDKSKVRFNPFTSQFRKDGSQSYDYTKCFIFGREIVDTFFLSIKYDIGRTFESYALKSIIKDLKLEKIDRTFINVKNIANYFKNRVNEPKEWELVKKYALEDSDDSLKLFDLMSPALFYFNQSVSKSFQEMICSATGSQVNNIMVRSYLQNLHSIAQADPIEHFSGAISFGIPGIYYNCFKQDVASLYPSIIRYYQIYNIKKDPSQHFLAMVEYFTHERIKNKKLGKETDLQYYKDLDASNKIAINSMYGFLGAPGLNYNYPVGASQITMYGREILEKAIVFATGKTADEWKTLANSEDEQDVET